MQTLLITSEKPKILVREQSIYGQARYYPACPKAVAITRLAGLKTITPDQVTEIESLGFDVFITNTGQYLTTEKGA